MYKLTINFQKLLWAMLWVMLTVGGSPFTSPVYGTDCGEVFDGSSQDLETLPRGSICLAAFNPAADRPIYSRAYGGKTFRFYINAERLLLIVSHRELKDQSLDPLEGGDPKRLRFPEDFLKIWFDDAQHWLKWLEGFEDSWCCRG